MPTKRWFRRRVLKALGGYSVVGLAGCSGIDGNTTTPTAEPTTNSPSNSTPEDSSTDPTKRTPTDTLTDTWTGGELSEIAPEDGSCTPVTLPEGDYPSLAGTAPKEFALAFEQEFAWQIHESDPDVSIRGYDYSDAVVVEESQSGTTVRTSVSLDATYESAERAGTIVGSWGSTAWYYVTDRFATREPAENRDSESETRPEGGWRIVACA